MVKKKKKREEKTQISGFVLFHDKAPIQTLQTETNSTSSTKFYYK